MILTIRTILISIVVLLLILLAGFWYSLSRYAVPVELQNKADLSPWKQKGQADRIFEVGKLHARSVFLYDPLSHQTLYARDEDTTLPLASLTKIMTALVALKDRRAKDAQRSPIFTNALKRMLVTSSNQSAELLASLPINEVSAGASSRVNFLAAMNDQALALGLHHTHFENPTGLDQTPTKAGAYGTAREVARLLWYAHVNYPSIIDQTASAHVRLKQSSGATSVLTNTDTLVDQTLPVLASKTGLTDLAGGNLALIFDAGVNHPMVAVVLGSTERGRFTDVHQLIRATLDYFAENLHS